MAEPGRHLHYRYLGNQYRNRYFYIVSIITSTNGVWVKPQGLYLSLPFTTFSFRRAWLLAWLVSHLRWSVSSYPIMRDDGFLLEHCRAADGRGMLQPKPVQTIGINACFTFFFSFSLSFFTLLVLYFFSLTFLLAFLKLL